MKSITISPIGQVTTSDERFALNVDEPYRPGLRELDGFGFIHVLWWADQMDTPAMRKLVECDKPYRRAPDKVGVFATRSPARPNPVAISPCMILEIDHRRGIVTVPYIDAVDGTPIIDIKPYHPAVDRVREAAVPAWCDHWPKWLEDSASFDWMGEFVNAR